MRYQQEIEAATDALLGYHDVRARLLVYAVGELLTTKLRKGVVPDDCGNSYICAAALLLASTLRQLQAQGMSGFDAGTLSVRFDGANAEERLAWKLLEPWLEAETAFRGVRA